MAASKIWELKADLEFWKKEAEAAQAQRKLLTDSTTIIVRHLKEEATENAALRARVEALEGAIRELVASYKAMKVDQDTPKWSASVTRVSRAFTAASAALAGGTAEKESAGAGE